MIDPPRMLPETGAQWSMVAALVLLLAILPPFVSPYYVGLLTIAMIGAMLALSLYLLVGATGLVSLGHGAFYGLAAYTVYLVSPEAAPRPIWQTLPLAMAVAGVAALAVGALSLKTRGFFFLMVTLAFGQMIFFVFHDTKLGGGTDGAYLGKPLLSVFGLTLDPRDLPRSQRGWPSYYVALTQLVLMYLLLAWLLRSLFGRVLEGIRVNEHRMQALGYDTTRYKLGAFVGAGMLAGAAGHMWSLHSGFVNPEIVGWHKSAEALLFILLGGLGSLVGPIVGAFAFALLAEGAQILADSSLVKSLSPWLAAIFERKLLIEGVVILIAVLLLPQGITGLLARLQVKTGAPRSAIAVDEATAGGARPGLRQPHHHARDACSTETAVSLVRRPARRARCHHHARAGRVACRHRPERRRQVDVGEPALGRARADKRPDRAGRPRRHPLARASPRASRHRPLVPAHQHLPEPQHARECAPRRPGAAGSGHSRYPAQRRPQPDRRRRGGAGPRRTDARPQPHRRHAVARPAASARDRHGARIEASRAAARRAAGRHGSRGGRAHRGPAQVARADLAILLIEHDMDFVFKVADRMTVMVEGTVLASGKPADVRANTAVQAAYLGAH